ncbi:MAG TPA: glutamyl-tRNA reductase [Cellulomonas sp.]
MLLCLSANHRNASFPLLERLSVDPPATTRALLKAAPDAAGAVVLATCNRFEAYLDLPGPAQGDAGQLVDALADATGVAADELHASLSVHRGDAVAVHLFAVSAGLESVVVGEEEIAGQVGRALEVARDDGTTTGELERLFQRAVSTSRGVKTRTTLGGTGRSLVRLALDLAATRVPAWATARVLVVGTGRYAGATVVALRERGVRDLRVFSPTGRGASFAEARGLTLETGLRSALAAVDVAVVASSGTVLRPGDVTAGRRLFVVDLGMPRNVEPSVGLVDGVELLDLETVRIHAPLEHRAAHDEARAIVGSAAADFAVDAVVGPAIVALRTLVFETLDNEVARARSRGGDDATEAALRHFAGVLVHRPSMRLRELVAQGRADEALAALDLLHGIRPERPPQP